jgi:hypothetical protein
VILTSGFGETGAAGRALQEAVLAAPGAAACASSVRTAWA